MSINADTLKEAARLGLEETLLPLVQGLEEDAAERLRLRMDRDLPELAARISSAALRGDQTMVDALEDVPALWFEQERIRVVAVQRALIRGAVRAVFRTLIEVAAAAA